MNFIGIDVHLHSVVAAVIDENLNIIDVSNVSFEEVINMIHEYLPIVIAIDAPSSLNKGLMNDEEYRKNIGRKINGHYNKKVSEYELSRRGINPFPTPDNIEKVRSRNDLSWMEQGFWLYNNLLDKGYKLLDQNNYVDSMEKGIVEVFPHASFSTLAGQLLQNKNTDEGLNQRWLLLQQLGLNNLDFIMKAVKRKDKDDYLDAIVAAYTGYAISNGKGSFVGDATEGQIALPIRDIKESYKRSKYKEKSIVKEYQDDCSYEYEFLHNDSVLWLKYFTPINNSPKIKEVINIEEGNFSVFAIITNNEGKSAEVELTNMRGKTQGVKVTDKYKSILKEFWGSHGDGITYSIKIIN
ncbi:putative nuclease with RNAse H fold [Clostridium saccharoperbutylacetonicum]|uniref:DUF429 domain-containing protein n=1 Tax=Clostridium saccharoperbutylacetonicum N1-4(HMT) TaxID=931276 RepID=M1MDE8_9CLOT|nr:DUF429 domain-containing protein [Clostridium saccharoperbutylacetonicum]AGF55949.1 hypothetical protein DUF429 [Clostridium saccharoperbutylacetonicum N1-4(HMT)]NRT63312.1 putative nuclease with RNAse H fold [Clostridium saccharoperbutylacetonicum]NSB26674.1 putative nuclease with RNAse H fold [Clostridium saccharoperbutylacetonicum]NSB46024.1 putative nuclease with RNAse H fold [Clostridium saccharoperbutylacetonicum]